MRHLIEGAIGQLYLLKKNRDYLSFSVSDGAQFVQTFDEMFRLAEDIESGNTLSIWLLRCSREHWPAFADLVKMVPSLAVSPFYL